MVTTNESRAALRTEIEALEKRARSLKTKKAQIKAWDAVHRVRHQLCGEYHELAEIFEGKETTCTILWFRPDDGDGMAKVDLGDQSKTIYFHACNDVKAKSWYAESSCITYESGQVVKAILKVRASSDGLDFSIGQIRGGKVDEVKYKELCKNKNRPFFKYPKAKGVTGLFAA